MRRSAQLTHFAAGLLQGGAMRELFSCNLSRGPAAGRSAARKLLVRLAFEVRSVFVTLMLQMSCKLVM